MPAGVAESLAARSETVAARLDAGDGCGARAEAEALQAETIAAVNDGRIPPRYHEDLVGTVNALVESIECAPPPPPPPADEDEETDEAENEQGDDEREVDEEKGDGKGRGNDKGKGKGKKK